MNNTWKTKAPEIQIKKLNEYSYMVYFDKEITVGMINRQGPRYVFFPEENEGLSVRTLDFILNKMKHLESEIYTTRYFS
jgi:hypothetical protein